jgi:hypothetical protein
MGKNRNFFQGSVGFNNGVIHSASNNYVSHSFVMTLSLSRANHKQSNSASANPPSTSSSSLRKTTGEKSKGSVAARVVGAATEPSYFYPGVTQRESLETESGFTGTRLPRL